MSRTWRYFWDDHLSPFWVCLQSPGTVAGLVRVRRPRSWPGATAAAALATRNRVPVSLRCSTTVRRATDRPTTPRPFSRSIDAKAGTIRFPAGTYRITKPIVVDLDKVGFTSLVADGTARLVMAGPGPAIQVHRHSCRHGRSEHGQARSLGAPAHAHRRGPGDCRRRTPRPTASKRAARCSSRIRGVHIRKCRHGIHLVERNRNVLIDACHIYENSGCGVYLDHVNLHQTNISASHISYCGGGGVVVRGGDVRNIHIAGCDIEANMAPRRPAHGQRPARLCRRQHGRSGHHRLHDPAHQGRPRVGQHPHSGQRLHEPPRARSCHFNCGHVTIGDNVLSDVQTNIHLVGVRGVTITGNTFWQGYAHNLLDRRFAASRRSARTCWSGIRSTATPTKASNKVDLQRLPRLHDPRPARAPRHRRRGRRRASRSATECTSPAARSSIATTPACWSSDTTNSRIAAT